MEAIILAGGKGSRMESEYPKALTPIKNKTILDLQLYYLFLHGVERVVLALGYRSNDIINHVYREWNMQNRGYEIIYSVETNQAGTAGALKLALGHCKEPYVLVLNCDDIADIDIASLYSRQRNTICVAHPRLPFGLVKQGDSGYAEFVEKPRINNIWVSCGWYLIARYEQSYLPDQGSLEEDVFQKRRVRLTIFEHHDFWMPINTRKDVEEFEKSELPEIFKDYLS
ncbi:MAG: nucleotidyltransferase family protein [Candidatus Aenigmatarchaeota archaeon]